MTYKIDPHKRLAQRLNDALNKGHRWAVIWLVTDKLELTGTDEKWLRVWSAWHPGTQLIEIKEKLKSLPAASF